MSWGGRRLAALAGCAVVAAGAAVSAGALGGAASDTPRPLARECPRAALRLPPDAIAGATRAALRHARRTLGAEHTRGMRALKAGLAPQMERGRQPLAMCGRRIQRRTVVVELLYPAQLPSASLSQGSLAVSLTPSGYRVWTVLH